MILLHCLVVKKRQMTFFTRDKLLGLFIWLSLISIVAGRYTEPAILMIQTIFIIYQIQKIYVSRRWILIGGLVFSHSSLMILLTGYGMFKFIQQIILLTTMFFCYYQIYHYCHKGVNEWFNKYRDLVYWLSLLGIVQFVIMSMTGKDLFPKTIDGFVTQNSGRLHAILMEPGNFAAISIPATAYVVLSKGYYLKNKKKSLVILTAFILTFTTSSFVTITIILLLKINQLFKCFKYLLVVIVAFGGFWIISNLNVFSEKRFFKDPKVATIELKMKQTLSISKDADPEYFERLNASSYASLTNYWVAFNAPFRMVGTGLGTHAQNYEHLYKSDYYLYGLNKDDAYSMFARLYSEFGIIGLCIYVLFLVKFYNKNNIISLCLLVFFISYLIKGGNYTLYGTAFFHFVYYFLSPWKNLHNQKLSITNQ